MFCKTFSPFKNVYEQSDALCDIWHNTGPPGRPGRWCRVIIKPMLGAPQWYTLLYMLERFHNQNLIKNQNNNKAKEDGAGTGKDKCQAFLNKWQESHPGQGSSLGRSSGLTVLGRVSSSALALSPLIWIYLPHLGNLRTFNILTQIHSWLYPFLRVPLPRHNTSVFLPLIFNPRVCVGYVSIFSMSFTIFAWNGCWDCQMKGKIILIFVYPGQGSATHKVRLRTKGDFIR